MGAITFDFHNTLVQGPAWFDLEVRELPAAFLRWRADRNGDPPRLADEDAARLAYRRLRREIIEHGNELPAERCVAQVLDELGIAAGESELTEGVETLMRAALSGCTLVPGAAATIRALAGSGVTLAVISSAVYHPFLLWALDTFGLIDAFAVVTTSASAGYYKSRPEIFLQTLAAIGAEPRSSVHVGDSYRFDVEMARRVGMRTVWLCDEPSGIDGPPPDLTLPDLVDAHLPILELRSAAARHRDAR